MSASLDLRLNGGLQIFPLVMGPDAICDWLVSGVVFIALEASGAAGASLAVRPASTRRDHEPARKATDVARAEQASTPVAHFPPAAAAVGEH
jgi:hypothetical protein